ncbi:GPO family capsid scaffolding protein [Cedecea davisae]|uniref:GPO family capsid scaffolding protein n=1 Tax=Cedecea davisae TaxID=158484 RepID=A0ABS6DBA0_9ENTR|nr:GPO family capsid scaffolding protein [Cedecea davisae]MBU4680497.1 GPO family capsid scaffolding protein [Cedecea davisae]MBU4684989.1 GPO family capsid scaffolding protein [Cedecea davisae]
MAKKAKRFRVGVEGATTDGRTIERVWLEQMAANYNPQVYTAVINMEHIKGYTPDSPFRRFGVVDKLEAEEIADGALAGKLALYAWITPTDELVSMSEKLQKLFTSMEVNPKFADTGEAYLVGLAVTDDPASLGTEMLSFSAGASASPLAKRKFDAGNLFTAAEETLLEFEEVQDEKPGLFARVVEMLSRKAASDKEHFSDVGRAVEAVAEEHQALAGSVTKLSEQYSSLKTDFSKRLDDMQQANETQKKELTELREQLSSEDSRGERRPFSTGGNGAAEELTNC